MNDDADEVRWFDPVGTCRCGKPAHGTLRGPRNDSYGPACTKCGEARVKRAVAQREKARHEVRPQIVSADYSWMGMGKPPKGEKP